MLPIFIGDLTQCIVTKFRRHYTRSEGYNLTAPRSLYWEIGNAFSAMVKRERINLEQAKAAIEIYEQIPINLVNVDLKQALEIVDKPKFMLTTLI